MATNNYSCVEVKHKATLSRKIEQAYLDKSVEELEVLNTQLEKDIKEKALFGKRKYWLFGPRIPISLLDSRSRLIYDRGADPMGLGIWETAYGRDYFKRSEKLEKSIVKHKLQVQKLSRVIDQCDLLMGKAGQLNNNEINLSNEEFDLVMIYRKEEKNAD